MRIRQIELPTNLDYGWVPRAPEFITLNKNLGGLVITRQRSGSINSFLNRGLAIQLNGGVGKPEILNVPFDERANFQLGGFGSTLSQAGKPVYQWTDSDYENAANFLMNERPVKYMTSSFGEADYDNPYAIFGQSVAPNPQNPDSFYKFHKLLGQKMRSIGGEHYGDYAGICNIVSVSGSGLLNLQNATDIVSDINKSLTFARNHSGFIPAYLTTDLHNYTSCIVKCYMGGNARLMTPHDYFVETALSYIIVKNSLKALNNTTAKLMGYYFSSNAEIGLDVTGYSEVYKRPLDAGGHVECWDFPNYSFNSHYCGGILGHILGDVVYWFGNERTFSSDPNKIGNDRNRGYDNFPEFKYYSDGSGNVPERVFTPMDKLTAADNGFFEKPYGYDDAMILAKRDYDLMVGWVGNKDWFPLSTKEVGSGKHTVLANKANCVDALINKGLSAYGFVNGNKIAFFVCSMADTTKDFEVYFGSNVVTIQNITPTVGYCYIGDLNASSN